MNNRARIKLNDLLLSHKSSFITGGATLLATPILGYAATGLMAKFGIPNGLAILSGLGMAATTFWVGIPMSFRILRYKLANKLFSNGVDDNISENNFTLMWSNIFNAMRYNLNFRFEDYSLETFAKKAGIYKYPFNIETLYKQTNALFPGLVETVAKDYISLGQIELAFNKLHINAKEFDFILRLNNYDLTKLEYERISSCEFFSTEKIKIIEPYFATMPEDVKNHIIKHLDTNGLKILKEEIESSSKVISTENDNPINNQNLTTIIESMDDKNLAGNLNELVKDYFDFTLNYQKELDDLKALSSTYFESHMFLENFHKRITPSIMSYQKMNLLYKKDPSTENQELLTQAQQSLQEQANIMTEKLEEIKKEIINLNLREENKNITISKKVMQKMK